MTTSLNKFFNQGAVNFFPIARSVIIFSLAGLVACNGGDGNGGGVEPPPPPTANISVFAGALGGAGNVDGTPGRLASPYGIARVRYSWRTP
jgi:hypothetical protein